MISMIIDHGDPGGIPPDLLVATAFPEVWNVRCSILDGRAGSQTLKVGRIHGYPWLSMAWLGCPEMAWVAWEMGKKWRFP